MVEGYSAPFLKEVIVRLDYSYRIMRLSKFLPQRIRDKASQSFPISEPKDSIIRELEITKHTTKVVKGTDWVFHSLDRKKTLIIANDNVNVSYREYSSFDVLKNDFLPIVNELFSVYDDFQGKRLGLRYVNDITLPENNVFDWTEYLNESLLNNLSFLDDPAKIRRAFTTLELNEGDAIVRFQYGMFNPDYPAPIQKKSFVLDYDAYHQGALNLEDIIPKLDSFNIIIDTIFQRSIKDGLRNLM